MAADILLYQADVVPVGDDQKQHVELTRDIAQRFNSLYPEHGETFTMPATHLPTVGARVMGLDDPEKKMSKSEPGAGHAIGLLDEPAVIRKKIMRATTDSKPGVDFDDPGAGVRNLLAIYQAFTESANDDMRARFSGMRYGDLKKTVAEAVVAGLEPIQQRYREITPEQITEAFSLGSERAGIVANTLSQSETRDGPVYVRLERYRPNQCFRTSRSFSVQLTFFTTCTSSKLPVVRTSGTVGGSGRDVLRNHLHAISAERVGLLVNLPIFVFEHHRESRLLSRPGLRLDRIVALHVALDIGRLVAAPLDAPDEHAKTVEVQALRTRRRRRPQPVVFVVVPPSPATNTR